MTERLFLAVISRVSRMTNRDSFDSIESANLSKSTFSPVPGTQRNYCTYVRVCSLNSENRVVLARHCDHVSDSWSVRA